MQEIIHHELHRPLLRPIIKYDFTTIPIQITIISISKKQFLFIYLIIFLLKLSC